MKASYTHGIQCHRTFQQHHHHTDHHNNITELVLQVLPTMQLLNNIFFLKLEINKN